MKAKLDFIEQMVDVKPVSVIHLVYEKEIERKIWTRSGFRNLKVKSWKFVFEFYCNLFHFHCSSFRILRMPSNHVKKLKTAQDGPDSWRCVSVSLRYFLSRISLTVHCYVHVLVISDSTLEQSRIPQIECFLLIISCFNLYLIL